MSVTNKTDTMSGKRPQRDQVTPYKLAMLMLVQEYCETMIEDRQQILLDEENVYSEKEERELMFTLLQLLQVRCHRLWLFDAFSTEFATLLKPG